MLNVCLCVYIEGALRWKEDLAQKATEAYLRHQLAAPNLRKLVYGTGESLNLDFIPKLKSYLVTVMSFQPVCFYFFSENKTLEILKTLQSVLFHIMNK